MREIFIEQLISVKKGNTAYIKMGLCIGFDILAVTVSFLLLFLPLVAVVFLPVAGLITYLTFRNQNLEYEYTLVNDQLDIDKIYSMRLRKKGMTFDLNKMEVMGDEKTHALNKKVKSYDFTSRDPQAKHYIMRFADGTSIFDLYFEPNEEIIEAIKYQFPRKVEIK